MLGFAYISVSAVAAAGGFALTATHFSKRRKVSKRLCPSIRCLAWARHALTPALLRGPAAIGHPWPGAANPASMPGCPLRRTSSRPLEGAGGSGSKAAGELTLGLLSGVGDAALPLLFCRSEPAREKRKSNALRQSARVIVNDHREQARSYRFCMYTAHPRRSKLARDGGLTVNDVRRSRSNNQTLPTRLSACPSETRSLACDRRCQFSDRDCKPANSLLGAYRRTYNRGAF